MERRLDTPHGRAAYGRRFATVELVCVNLRHSERFDCLTPRGREQVDGPCMVHSNEKLAHACYAASQTTGTARAHRAFHCPAGSSKNG